MMHCKDVAESGGLSCFSMCLFLQNQDFQKHTETVLNLLSTGARQAAEQLALMTSGMSSQLTAVGRMNRSLEGLQQGWQRIAAGVEKGEEGLQQLQSGYLNLDEQLTAVIRNEVRCQPLAA